MVRICFPCLEYLEALWKTKALHFTKWFEELSVCSEIKLHVRQFRRILLWIFDVDSAKNEHTVDPIAFQVYNWKQGRSEAIFVAQAGLLGADGSQFQILPEAPLAVEDAYHHVSLYGIVFVLRIVPQDADVLSIKFESAMVNKIPRRDILASNGRGLRDAGSLILDFDALPLA